MQDLAVGLIVLACTVYAVWSLLPLAWRRGMARAALGWAWLGRVAFVQRRLQALANAGGCGCSGCDNAAPPKSKNPQDTAQPIRIHRRAR